MFILIGGGGKLGYYLAKHLLASGEELAVIEKDTHKVDRITEQLGSIAIQGDACDPTVLANAGCERADMVLAVTGDDEDNLVICQVAKSRFNVSYVVARVNNPRNEEIFRRLGIDAPISSTSIILNMIEDQLNDRGVMTSLSLKGGDIELVESRVSRDSPVCGRALRDLHMPHGCSVAMVLRGRETIVPDGSTVIEENDTVLAIAKSERHDDLRRILTGHGA